MRKPVWENERNKEAILPKVSDPTGDCIITRENMKRISKKIAANPMSRAGNSSSALIGAESTKSKDNEEATSMGITFPRATYRKAYPQAPEMKNVKIRRSEELKFTKSKISILFIRLLFYPRD